MRSADLHDLMDGARSGGGDAMRWQPPEHQQQEGTGGGNAVVEIQRALVRLGSQPQPAPDLRNLLRRHRVDAP